MRALTSLLALLPLLGLAELALHRYFATRAPGLAAYEALAPELLRRKRPGIPVVVAPRWAEPLLRQAAPAAFPIGELARPDDSGFAGFLEVSLLGQQAPELAQLPIRERQRSGEFSLVLHDNPGFVPRRFDFVGAVESGEVEVWHALSGQRSACPWRERARGTTGGLHGAAARPSQGFDCAGERAASVSLIEDEQYRARRCILVDPPRAGQLVLHFSSVPASARLVGFAGFPYFQSRDDTTRPVELTIAEAGRELGRHAADPRAGWQRFDLPRPAPGGAVELTLARRAGEPLDFCFALEAR